MQITRLKFHSPQIPELFSLSAFQCSLSRFYNTTNIAHSVSPPVMNPNTPSLPRRISDAPSVCVTTDTDGTWLLLVVAWLVMTGKSVGVVAVDTGCATGVVPLVVVIGIFVLGLVEIVVVEQLVQSVQDVHSELQALSSHVLLFVQPGQSDPGHLSSGQDPDPHGPAAPVGHGPSSVQVCVESWYVDQDPPVFHELILSQSLVAPVYAPVLLHSSVASDVGLDVSR